MIASRFLLQLSSLAMFISSVISFSIPDVHHLHSAVTDTMNHVVLPHAGSSINIASADAIFDPLSGYKGLETGASQSLNPFGNNSRCFARCICARVRERSEGRNASRWKMHNTRTTIVKKADCMVEDVTAFDNIDKMEAKIDASSFAIDRPRFCRGVVSNSSLLLLSYL